MMKKNTFRICFIILYFGILASCVQANFLFKPTHTKRSEWLTKWLYEPSCSPPCWEQMTPGDTTINEGLSLIKKLNGVSIKYSPGKGLYDDRKQMMWDFNDSNSSGSGTTDKQGDVISDISLQLNSEENLRISEIISIYGPPEYVNTLGCFGELTNTSCDVHLIYPKIGMSLGLYLPDQGTDEHNVEISSDLSIRTIVFFSPGVDNYLKALGVFDNFVKWSGYTEYRFNNP